MEQQQPSAKAATTASAKANDDETIAQSLKTIEHLVEIYGFDKELAKEAVEAIPDKSNVQEAVDYIFNNFDDVEDKGGPIYPKSDCPHVKNHVNFDLLSKLKVIDNNCGFYNNNHEMALVNNEGKSVKDYEDDKPKCISHENWICLECTQVRCSRYINGHSLVHYKSTDGHCIALSISDLSIWCYACNSYIIHGTLKEVLKHFELLKFDQLTFDITH